MRVGLKLLVDTIDNVDNKKIVDKYVCCRIVFGSHLTCSSSSVTEKYSVLKCFKSQPHQNGMKLGDFYGSWNVNTKKKLEHDSSKLSG